MRRRSRWEDLAGGLCSDELDDMPFYVKRALVFACRSVEIAA